MTTLALEYFRSAPRYLGARAVGSKAPGLLSGPLAPLRLVNVKDPEPPKGREGWARVKPLMPGICGSDLSTIAGRSSFYFSPLVSTPFVPGHEIVGELLEDCERPDRRARASCWAACSRAPREASRCARTARPGATNICDRVTVGDLKAGLQTGYCNQTGGGWSRMMVAHRSQLHPIPDEMSNEVAVLVEPFACAIHAVKRAGIQPGQTVLVAGAGTVGILSLIALELFAQPGHVIVAAKHQKQRAAATMAGADEVVRPEHATKAVRRHTSAVKLTPERGQDFLLGGVDVTLECTGSKSALDLALRSTKANGRVLVSGIPGGGADLTPLWFRELELVGAYTATGEDFATAIGAAANLPILEQLVGATYPLDALARRDRPRDVRGVARHVQGGLPAAGLRRPTTDATTRIRARGGRADAAAARQRGRGVPDAALPARHQGDLPARCAAGSRRRRRAHPARAAAPDRRREAAARAAARGDEAHDRRRRHLDPAAADGHARYPPADPRARDRARRTRRRRRPRDRRRDRAAPADDRVRDPPDGRRTRVPIVLAEGALQPRRRGRREHDGRRPDRPRRDRADPEARRRVRPDRLRQHQPGRDGRRPQVGRGRARRLREPQAPPQRQHDAALAVLHGPARGPQRDQRLRQSGWAGYLRRQRRQDLPDRDDDERRDVPVAARLPEQARVGVVGQGPGR